MTRARAWLESAPPARKEIVVISDFQHGALHDRQPELEALPKAIGLRLVAVGRTPDRRTISGADLLGADAVGRRTQAIGLTRNTTELTVTSLPGSERRGLRILSRGDSDRARRAVAVAGAPAGLPEEPLAVRFVDIDRPEPQVAPSRVGSGWMLGTLLRLQNDPELRAEALRVQSTGPLASYVETPTSPWSIVAHDPQGRPLVVAGSSGQELLIDVAAPSESLLGAVVLRGVLMARRPTSGYAEREIARIDEAVLRAWNRQPSPVEAPSGPEAMALFRNADDTDARWCWLAVLAAIGIEQWLRARRPDRAQGAGEVTRAAA